MIIASKWFRPLPGFSVDQFANVGSGLNRSATLSKALKKVNNLSNGRRIKFELDQTFVRLSFDFSFVLLSWVVSKPFERFIQIIQLCPTFARRWSRMNVGEKSKPLTCKQVLTINLYEVGVLLVQDHK